MADNGGAAALRLITLGAMRLLDASGREKAPGQRKLLALLAYLALEAPRAPSREEVATLLWGERPDDNARGSLRQALFQLKRIVGDALDVKPDTLGLRAGALDLDVMAMQADVARGGYREAALRWNGEFLAGADDLGTESFRIWLETERARVRGLAARAFDTLTSEAATRGAWAEAASWAERWTHVQPLEEGPTRRLVEALSLAGRSAEALARHAGFVARLRAELGTGPSDLFVRLGSQLERRARAAATASPRGSAALLPPDLVGRDDAFATLTNAWRDARRGRPVLIVVEGDAGVGKTRLVEEFLRGVDVARGAAVVLRARAQESDRDTALATARDLLARLCDAPGLLGAPRSALAELAAVLPALADQLQGLPAPSTHARALDEAVARVLTDVGAEAPVIAFVDDVGRADAESRRLILSLVRRVEAAPVLWILTAARAELRATADLRGVGDVRYVKVEPLALFDVEGMLASMLRLTPEDRRLLAERIVADVGAHPLDVVETMTVLVDQGYLTPDGTGMWRFGSSGRPGRLPLASAVRDAVRRRIDASSDLACSTLEAMAVVGSSVSPTLLAELLGRDDDEVNDALTELVARRFVRAVDTGRTDSESAQYEIASESARRVAADRVPDERRAKLHSSRGRYAVAEMASDEGDRRLDRLDARYTIGPALSEGKLVSTFEARHLETGDSVVLYLLRGGALVSAARFLKTLERVAAFSHPNITPIVDFGVTTEAFFYATARTDGPSLREHLTRERPLAIDDATRIALEIGETLVAAHECGILHGDLRPKHVTLTPTGAKLAGLGVVQALGTQEGPGGPEGTGVMIGAPAYLSPEQLSGDGQADVRSDMYSWGCVLYEMLVGELPFVGSTRSVIARKLTQAAPSARARREALPKQVDRVLRTCLARVPADRFAAMAEALQVLNEDIRSRGAD